MRRRLYSCRYSHFRPFLHKPLRKCLHTREPWVVDGASPDAVVVDVSIRFPHAARSKDGYLNEIRYREERRGSVYLSVLVRITSGI